MNKTFLQRLPIVASIAAILVAGVPAIHSSESTPITKETVVQTLVEKVIRPGYADLSAKCRALADAAGELERDPSPEALQKTRDRWVEAALANQRLECFKLGPVVETGHVPLFYFRPARPASIERAVAVSSEKTGPRLEELGAAAKSVFALEYLLFPRGSADQVFEQLSTPTGEPRRRYVALVAGELATKAQHLEKEWQEPLSSSAKRFAEGGQESINSLVRQLSLSVESTTERRLRPVLSAAAGEKTTEPVNRNTATLLRASLEGVQRMYAGGDDVGLDDYLRQLGSPVAERFEQEFSNAMTALAEFERHPEPASREKLDKARIVFSTCHALELVINVDLTSALGVTLTFSPVDGD